MSDQHDILALVRERPGITQTDIVRILKPCQPSFKLQALRTKGDIIRVSLGKTFAIFPTETE